MSAQMTWNRSFPTPCKLCGGALYQQVDSCPYCGTDRPLGTAAHARPKATPGVVRSAAAPMPAIAKVSLAGAAASPRPSVQADYLHHYRLEDQRPFWHTGKGLFVKGVLLIWLIAAIAYAAFLLYGERRGQEREVRASRASLVEKGLPNANAALARDSDNQARELQRDSAPAQRRDSALQGAERCASQRAWDCVRTGIEGAGNGSRQPARALVDGASHRSDGLVPAAFAKWRRASGCERATAARCKHRTAAFFARLARRQTGRTERPGHSRLPPPLPGATSASANGNPPDLGSASASVTTSAASPASDENGADAQQRAILQLGWKHAASSETSH